MNDLCAASGGVRPHLFGTDRTDGTFFGTAADVFDPAFLQSWRDHYHRMNPWAPGFFTNRPRKALYFEELCPDAKLKQTEYYQDWVRPQDDISRGGAAVLIREADRFFAIGGSIRARDAEALEAPFVALLDQLIPRLLHALKVNRALHEAQIHHSLSSALIAARGSAVFALGLRGKVLSGNASAEALMEEGEVLKVTAFGHLTLRDPDAQDWLSGHLSAARGVADRSSVHLLRASRLEDEQVCRVVAMRDGTMPDPMQPFTPLFKTPILALILTPRVARGPVCASLMAALGLTASEVEIVEHLMRGRTKAEIASRRRTSLHTIRNQIKAALQKAGVRSTGDLLRLADDLTRG